MPRFGLYISDMAQEEYLQGFFLGLSLTLTCLAVSYSIHWFRPFNKGSIYRRGLFIDSSSTFIISAILSLLPPKPDW
jgi:hypothetical protein